jgi:hypothetical protein
MKKCYLLLLLVLPASVWAQCNLSNATDCDCLDGSDACDLLPDITVSYDLLANPTYQPEYDGELGVSISTPNIGHGPLRVFATDYYVCGGDTIYDAGGMDACPDGTNARQIIKQRIYSKDGSDMTYWERNAGTMTYHPGHGHFHVDDWGVYTLRQEVPGLSPTEWPIIGSGAKLGFCLMDYGSCNWYDGYCVNDDGVVITTDAPNYGLGGGGYSCGVNNQGISAGYLDIYYYYLEGMSIALPDNMCNGDYKIVTEVDPNHYFLEESDDNNVMVADITITDQPENDFGYIAVNGSKFICETESVELSAPLVGTSYLWSNGATTSTIEASEPGLYYCTVERTCGLLYTDTIEVTVADIEEPVLADPGTVCEGTTVLLTATAGEDVTWFDADGNVLGAGMTYETTELYENTTFYANNTAYFIDEGNGGKEEHTGADLYNGSTYNGYLIFDAEQDFVLQSVKVYTDTPGERTVELRTSGGTVLQSITVDIPVGESRIDLGFEIEPGSNYLLGTNGEQNNASFGYQSPQLRRNAGDVAYPYIVGTGIATITGASADGYYYYFYDWEYNANKLCTSELVAAEVKVEVCSGISEVAGIKDLEIFPNPNDGTFHISADFPNTTELTIQVRNLTGQTVYSSNEGQVAGNTVFPIDLQEQPAGIYIVSLVSEGKAVARQIIVE